MGYKVITLSDLVESVGEQEAKKIIVGFKSIPSDVKNDVECFLHSKAIEFEKASISTTHLVFKFIDGEFKLVGYFSLANKKLIISRSNYSKLSSNQRQKLCKKGDKTDSGAYYINSYLIGQIGKNYSGDIPKGSITGRDLLSLAYNNLLDVNKIIKAKYVWIECEPKEKLIGFYERFGFKKIKNFESKNGLTVMIMKLMKPK